MDTTMDKRIRRRMTLIKSEQHRARKAQFKKFSSAKSFSEIKEEREAMLAQRGMRHDASCDERDDSCNASIVSDCVSEMRRRRVYEMTHGRPYPTTSTKKKHNFWQPEEDSSRSRVPSSSFSEQKKTYTLPVVTPLASQPSSSPERTTARVLWKVETANLQHDVEALVLKESNAEERRRMKDCFIKDEIMDGAGFEDDELMTPVRIKKFIDAYDDAKNNRGEQEGIVLPFFKDTFEQNESFINAYAYDYPKDDKEEREGIVPPFFEKTFTQKEDAIEKTDHAEIAATVTEISTGTQALAAFVTSAVCVMKEAKTPVKNSVNSEDLKEIEQHALSAVTPYKAAKLFQEKIMCMAVTPSNKLITKVPTPMTTKTMDSSMDEAEIMVKKLSLGDSISDDDDDADDDTKDNDKGVDADADADTETVTTKVDYGVLWPSLFHDEESDAQENFPGVIDTNRKQMLEALVEGGALQREIDGTNILKLYVDMYHNHTFERVVHAIQELKGLQALVICRAIDKTRSTYRTIPDIKSLFDATKKIQRLNSLMLLNFTPDSMTDLAMMIHSQSHLYRLEIQMAHGTLNGELLGVMATAPCLTHVLLELHESCSFGTLMNSKTLQTVRVNSKSLELKSSHVRTLVYSLQSNLTLTSLDLSPAISVAHFRSLCHTLKHNYRLESLRVNLELKTEDESNIVAMELANLFRVNRFLINVWNYSHQSCNISDTIKRDLSAALQSNASMQEFKFFSDDLCDWKSTKHGNSIWLEGNPNYTSRECSTVYTADGGLEDGEASFSVLSYNSSVDKSHLGDETFSICGFESSDIQGALSDLSQACDCSGLKTMSNKLHNWATTSTSATATSKNA
mmetsp:Transcript_27514/g.60539  ORF Transcript_27514/g.60539 Transcript_27514/m.60539 type:complete len:853 (-) Transcript_27514:138-2696(-)